MVSHAYSQGVINIQSGSGTPTDMGVGALLGALLAPMVSKGSDAKLVGGMLGALAGGAYGTAQMQQQQGGTAYQQSLQQEQMKWYMQQQQQQMVQMQQQMMQMNTASGYDASVKGPVKMGISKGKMVQSPYSRFCLDPDSMNMVSGEVVYDPIYGKPFRLP
jgi:hypothetical protein